MELLNITEQRQKRIILAVLLAATVVLIVVLAAAFSTVVAKDDVQTGKSPSDDATGAGMLLSADAALHNRLNQLEQLDREYAILLTDSGTMKNFDSINLTIASGEEAFRLALDSFERSTNKIKDDKHKNEALRLLTTFRTLLQHRKSIATFRNTAAFSDPSISADEKQLIQLQSTLMDKDEKISELETSIAMMASQKQRTETPAVTAMVNADNANENKLKETIVLLESKLGTLTELNNDLKNQNEQLQKKGEISSIASTLTDTELKNKNASLQQRIEDLDAEIKLAQVDCNLSRVDATQIISSARQRKQLLAEASSILTDLSIAKSPDLRKRVNEKIARLNLVAANSRE